jgi:diaminopimelate epimerase
MKIQFTKAHGAKNDFLLTWAAAELPGDLPAAAQAICERHTGAGADGWMLVWPASESGAECDGRIRLFNSDGSEPEISGNGTRCAAAFLIAEGLAQDQVRILTGAGVKHLRLIERRGLHFEFEMNMGRPGFPEGERSMLSLRTGPREVTIVHVGNPQCAVFVDDFSFDWRAMGAELERHPHFPNRTNVSFIRPAGEHEIDVRFYERGAGETMSSGTGSTGAVAAAIKRGVAQSPVRVLTPAGPLDLRWSEEIFMIGPADIVGTGEFYL